nr:alpha/beta hydrolase [uncultured Janthinobacterium sp.]
MTMTFRLFPLMLLALSTTAAAADLPPPAVQAATFAQPQQLIDIGGRRLHLHCSGDGPVTVIFDAPSGDAGWSWFAVQPQVAQQTRACVYDRAGLGFSDPSGRSGTSEHAVDDLHRLLAAARIAPPYVLVGNSYGGANVQLYAYRYPAEVQGLVLVEAMHEDEKTRLEAVTQGKLKQASDMQAAMEKQCVAQSLQGFVPGSEMLLNCTGGVQQRYGRSLAAVVLASELTPSYWQAASSENAHFDDSNAQLRAARKPLGALPLVVLTRGVSPYAVPGKPQSALNKALEDENATIQGEMAALSTQGVQRIVPGAGHIIQADQPAAVVLAVGDVLKALAR